MGRLCAACLCVLTLSMSALIHVHMDVQYSLSWDAFHSCHSAFAEWHVLKKAPMCVIKVLNIHCLGPKTVEDVEIFE